MNTVVIQVYLLLCCLSLELTSSCYVGTTPQIKEMVKGKCLQFQTTIQPDIFCNSQRNCDDVAEKFMGAFTNQQTCNVPPSRYDDFLQLTRHTIPSDKAIFWENVYEAVTLYGDEGRRLVTIADTLYGHIADNLHFCAQFESPGMIMNETCAGFDATGDCEQNAEHGFWVAASKQFSLDSSGKVYIMMNASIENTFKEKSYFATYELPNLTSDRVTDAEIFLVKYPGHEQRSTCIGESIKLLKSILKKNGLDATCTDSPRSVRIVLCSDFPDHPECALVSKASKDSGIITTCLLLCLYLIFKNIL